MARGKNRSKASKKEASACNNFKQHCQCVKCITERNLSGKNGSTPASCGHRNKQDVLDLIEYHWKILSTDNKHFLLRPGPKTFVDFVNFWSQPQRIANARESCACSVSGSSWFLALNYMFLDRLYEAQALILQGSFMQECQHRRIEDIATICNRAANPHFHFFQNAFMATQTRQSMEAYLHQKLPPSYIRRMSFASQSARGGKGHSIVGDYINFISNDWNGASSTSAAAARRREKGVDNTSIEVVMRSSDTNEESTVAVGMSTTLKSIFNNYADEKGVSLRSLRFVHDGKILFLSLAANRTAEQLGIKHGDTIHISSTEPSVTQVSSSSVQPQKKSGLRKKKMNKKNTKKKSKVQTSTAVNAVTSTDNYESDKIEHSKQLSHVFEEAQPLLKSIRQQLNSLSIKRTLPKMRKSKKLSKAAVVPIMNTSTTGLGGKAGKSQYVVQVGESCNLYKTSKRSSSSLKQQKAIVTDLHGLTKEEALSKLETSLPLWTDMAMKGSYPFVIPVKIVCGGGSQVLSELVENWVKEKDCVSNAPRNLYAV